MGAVAEVAATGEEVAAEADPTVAAAEVVGVPTAEVAVAAGTAVVVAACTPGVHMPGPVVPDALVSVVAVTSDLVAALPATGAVATAITAPTAVTMWWAVGVWVWAEAVRNLTASARRGAPLRWDLRQEAPPRLR
jgi:hypothetical protein